MASAGGERLVEVEQKREKSPRPLRPCKTEFCAAQALSRFFGIWVIQAIGDVWVVPLDIIGEPVARSPQVAQFTKESQTIPGSNPLGGNLFVRGPFKSGYWMKFAKEHKFTLSQSPQLTQMTCGTPFRVTKAFVDADGDNHPVGEEWTFIMSMFNRLASLYMVCAAAPSGEEWEIPVEKREILDTLCPFGERE